LTSEFDKLGLRVGEKHLMEVLKADQNIGKIYVLNAAGILQNSRIL
jgi:peptidyl-prolyl cis-trans isomerase D